MTSLRTSRKQPLCSPPEGARSRRGLIGLLSALGISQLGTRMSFLAVPWLALTISGSPATAGAVAFAELLPYVVVQALGGPLVDRIGARRTSIACDAAAAVMAGAVPAIALFGTVTIAPLAALMAATGLFRGAGGAAREVLVPHVTDQAATPIERSAGLYDGVARLAGLAGAPFAGVLVQVASPSAVLGVDAATFGCSAVLIAATVTERPKPLPGNGAEHAGYLASLREGYRFLRGDRLLLGIAVMVLVTNTIDQAQGTVLSPVWARDVAHSPVALGLIGGTFSLGAVAGNAGLTWLSPRMPRRLVYSIGYLLAGAPRYVAMALATTVSPVLPVALIAGFGAGSINPVLGAVQYERIPRHLQARVLGVLGATAWAGMPIGSIGGGALVDALGVRPVLWIAGGAYFATTLAPLCFPAWRGMDRSGQPGGEPG